MRIIIEGEPKEIKDVLSEMQIKEIEKPTIRTPREIMAILLGTEL